MSEQQHWTILDMKKEDELCRDTFQTVELALIEAIRRLRQWDMQQSSFSEIKMEFRIDVIHLKNYHEHHLVVSNLRHHTEQPHPLVLK